MILYHGSNVEINKIDLIICRPYKDFGKGFYTTEIEKQAINMAKRTVRQFDGVPYITKYSINDAEFEDNNLSKITFKAPTNDWALFVINNRNKNYKDIANKNCNTDNKYDVVIGPVANDDIRLLFDLFEDKILSIDELTKRLEYKELTNQISFHTEKAIKLLIKIESYKI